MTTDEFVIAMLEVKSENESRHRRNPHARCTPCGCGCRQAIGDVMRQYLLDLGCTPSMLDWATDQIQTRYATTPIRNATVRVVADELERMVRA